MIAGPSSLWRNPRGPVAVKMQWLRNVSGLDGAPPRERRPVLPVGASHRHRCAKRSEILPRSERRKARTAWNADLWSARAGARNQHRWRCACQHEFRETANRCLRRSAGRLGTPTSGQFSRWGPASRGSAKPAPGALRPANISSATSTPDGATAAPPAGAAPSAGPAGCAGGSDHECCSRWRPGACVTSSTGR